MCAASNWGLKSINYLDNDSLFNFTEFTHHTQGSALYEVRIFHSGDDNN